MFSYVYALNRKGVTRNHILTALSSYSKGTFSTLKAHSDVVFAQNERGMARQHILRPLYSASLKFFFLYFKVYFKAFFNAYWRPESEGRVRGACFNNSLYSLQQKLLA